MKLSPRETLLACLTSLAALAGLTYLFAEPRVRELARLSAEQRKVAERITVIQKMVNQKPVWDKRLKEVERSLPEYAPDKDVTADLLIALDRISKTHNVSLTRREAEKEKHVGQVYEMALQCSYEATLENLVHFLLELQSQAAILDVNQLSVKPEKEILKGGFNVNGVYRRTGKPPGEAAERAPTAMPPAASSLMENTKL